MGPEIGLDLGDARLGAVVIGHVPLVGLDAGLGGEGRGLLVIAGIGGRHGVSFGLKRLGDGFTNPARPAGHQCYTSHSFVSSGFVAPVHPGLFGGLGGADIAPP
jgi:hypothetical protein